MGACGYWVGHALGAVIGKLADKADVARAVTATATVAFFLLCLSMAAVYLASMGREQRKEESRPPPQSPPAVTRHQGRTTQEWITLYQKRDPESWKEASAALKAIGTAECVAAYVHELEGERFKFDKHLDAIQALDELAARGQWATRTALPALQKIAVRQPAPGAERFQAFPIELCASAAAKAVRTIQALK